LVYCFTIALSRWMRTCVGAGVGTGARVAAGASRPVVAPDRLFVGAGLGEVPADADAGAFRGDGHGWSPPREW